jgi:hypothetical protein
LFLVPFLICQIVESALFRMLVVECASLPVCTVEKGKGELPGKGSAGVFVAGLWFRSIHGTRTIQTTKLGSPIDPDDFFPSLLFFPLT